MNWPTFECMEIVHREIAAASVEIARWRDSADRSIGFNRDVKFLIATDPFGNMFPVAYMVFAAAYPSAVTGLFQNFEQVSELTREFRPPLLVLMPQNLLLDDSARGLARLMHDMPELQLQLHSGSAGILDVLQDAGLQPLYDCAPHKARIHFGAVPIHPVDFHKLIAERFHLPKPYDPKSRPSWADISGQ